MSRTKSYLSVTVAIVLALTMMVGTVSINAVTKPTQMTLSASYLTVITGDTAKITVKSVTPKKASKAVTFSSSDAEVASVSGKGVVAGNKVGIATITVKSRYNTKLKKTVAVSVIDIDQATKTVSFPARVNNTTEKSMHFVVNAKGTMAKYSLFTTNVTSKDVSNALKSLGATAWDSNYNTIKKYTTAKKFMTVKQAVADGYGNSSYSRVEVKADGKTMSEILSGYSDYESVFANVYNATTNTKSGCIICSTSCYYGVVADNNKSIGNSNGYLPNTDQIPAKGGIATISIQVK